MASACAWSVALVGLEGRIVEMDIGAGLPRTVLVALPDSALYQARDRCKAAVSNSGQEWPISLLTINLRVSLSLTRVWENPALRLASS